ncbi:hypothetical protein GZH47_18645 [Paenibacillus rhizovicinus]|uniref:Bacterial transcriptional activator domain-containing protein n=1 Tax=Paenibacillus rhizovicinus TaxID=2704463 RepID=A0A6C0P2Z1_9BACL|nr:bacterial transcriptional activator domain-containing protein [Paenibacillus rhizovicinus]QHW32636.1 hypothetical protein GZH47_18645 [Paenibacillus rhizovicinus]
MNQYSNYVPQQHQWLGQVMKAEQIILDGHLPPMEQLLAIPAEIRMKSPLLLRVECENGLLHGQLAGSKQRLEAALRGFAAQADESAMLTMMAMLGLLYIQVGDKQESKPFMSQLEQEWKRNPENCSGFVPWALARAAANAGDLVSRMEDVPELLMAAAERFREEGRPLWASFVLLDGLIFDPRKRTHPDWQFWMNWLKRRTEEQSLTEDVLRVLTSVNRDKGMCGRLPARYAYLTKAVLLNEAEERLPEELSDDVESGIYAAGAAIRRQLAEGMLDAAAEGLRLLDRQRRLVSTPAIEQLAAELRAKLELRAQAANAAQASEAAESPKARKAGTAKSVQPSSGKGLKPILAPAHESERRSTQATPAIEPSKWKIKLFGGIAFSQGNGQHSEPVWKRRKAGELFVHMLMQQGYKSNKEQIIERVFGEGDPAKRSNQLYVTLHDLRSALKEVGLLEDAVYAKRGVIGISEQIVESVDAETFMTLSRVGDQLWTDDREEAARLFEKAIPLYGMLAPELPYSEWLERTREQLLDRQTNMLRRLAAYYGESNEEAREEQRLSDWIALRPEQEEAYEAMIKLCLRGFRRVEAIGWYRRLERICKEELGIEPREEVRKLLWS